MLSDFSLPPSEHTNITHLNHWSLKRVKENLLIAIEPGDNGNGISAGRREQLLITLKQTLFNHKIRVVGLVDCIRSCRVKIYKVVRSTLGALWPQLLQISCVQSWVGSPSTTEVVQSVKNERTVSSAKCMSTCNDIMCILQIHHLLSLSEEDGEFPIVSNFITWECNQISSVKALFSKCIFESG